MSMNDDEVHLLPLINNNDFDNSSFSLRTMPGYTFYPSSADWVSSMNDDNDTEDRIDTVADKASEQQQHSKSLSARSKQLALFNMWKK